MKGSSDLVRIKEGVDKKWYEFSEKISAQLKNTNAQAQQLREFIKNTKDYAMKQDFKAKLEIEVKKANKLKSILTVPRYKDTFIESNETMLMRNLTQKNLVDQTNHFAFASLIAGRMNIAVTNIEESINNVLSVRTILKGMSEESHEEVRKFIKEIDEASKKSMTDIKLALEKHYEGEMKTVTDYIKQAFISRKNQFNIYDMNEVNDLIKNINSGKYTKDQLDENNPIVEALSSFVNNTTD